jgi:undecaprenyl-diphosphatase
MTSQPPSIKTHLPFYLPLLCASALLGAFGMLADEVLEGDTLTFDNAVTALFRTPGNPADPIGPVWLEEAVRDITSLGSATVLTMVTAAAVLFLMFSRRRRMGGFVAASVVSGSAISAILKIMFDRPRPDVAAAARIFTASFPSGHATLSAVTYLTLGALLTQSTPIRSLKVYFVILAVFLTLIVGISRVYIGVHYPTDVVGGWALGTAWALLCWCAWRFFMVAHDGIAR